MKNAMIAVVNTPGAASGTTALRNAWNGVAPSTCAACSSSQGICRKNAARVQMEIGNVNDRYGMIRPGQVSYSPIMRYRLNSGVTMEATGNTDIARAVVRNCIFTRNTSREVTYGHIVTHQTAITYGGSEIMS